MAEETIVGHCEDCGGDTPFPVSLAESVQVCAHCGAYMDVPPLEEGAAPAPQTGAAEEGAAAELDEQLDRLEEILVRQENLSAKLEDLIKRGEEVATRLEAVLEQVEE